MSYNEAFDKATRCNDSLEIHLYVISMLANTSKFDEMEKVISKVKRKFKQELKMWIYIGRVYYKNKQLQKARSFKDSALKAFTKRQCK